MYHMIHLLIRQAVSKSINSKGHYRQIKLVRLVGMMLIVFIKHIHVDHVKNIASVTVGTGIMGKLVTKKKTIYIFVFYLIIYHQS